MSRRRRWWIIGSAATLVTIAVLSAAAWFVVVPEWRPPLRTGETYGIDVASHQGEIDWRSVAQDDIKFAYIKATEGGDFVDHQFERNWRDAGAAGVDRGAYHFFTLCVPGADQARHFLKVVPGTSDALPPAVDLELAGNCSARPTQARVNDELDAFIARVEAAWGEPLILYVGDDWERAYPTRARSHRPLWNRRFLRRPDVDGWTIWQVHGLAHVDGIDGRVDFDIMRPSA